MSARVETVGWEAPFRTDYQSVLRSVAVMVQTVQEASTWSFIFRAKPAGHSTDAEVVPVGVLASMVPGSSVGVPRAEKAIFAKSARLNPVGL